MKLKTSFITNSSSANFILTAIRNVSRDEFSKFLDEFKLNYCKEFSGQRYTSELNNISIKYERVNKVVFNYWTSMLNDEVEDMPHFMKHFIVKYLMNQLKGITDLKLEIESDS